MINHIDHIEHINDFKSLLVELVTQTRLGINRLLHNFETDFCPIPNQFGKDIHIGTSTCTTERQI